MIYKVDYIKDVLGNNFLGIKFRKGALVKYLKQLENILGDSYETYISNQARRDNRGDYTHHCTVVNVMDFNKLSNQLGEAILKKVETIQDMDITDLEFKGVGTATRGENTTYFLVLNSNTLDEILKYMGIKPKDFHVTLGFDKNDVFGVRKNVVVPIQNKTVKLVKELQAEYGDLSWVYELDNFPPELKKIPLDLIRTNRTLGNTVYIIVGGYQVGVSFLDIYGKLRVVNFFENEKEK